jgi:hypothetical protein
MKKLIKGLCLAAMVIALVAGAAEAGKGGGGGGGKGGGGGVPTNYGCMTFQAGKVFTSPDGLTTKTLLSATYTCYLCNLSTGVCTVQSPASLVGWTFHL